MKPVRTVVITGGAGELGRSVARWWAKPGIRLIIIDQDATKLDAFRRELIANGADVTALVADLTVPGELDAVAASVPNDLEACPLSLVIAHGVSGRSTALKPGLEDLDYDQWQLVIDANLSSVVFVTACFLPVMKTAGGGRIVLVSSTAALAASPTAALSYSVSKAGVAALPKLLAAELASSQILINAVAPGKFANSSWPDDDASVSRYASSVPLGRIASADEIATLIGFLSSDANTYLTGQTIVQDGARLAVAPRGL